jgi:tetratricopeptide (TPR) repeat protein
VAGVRAALLSLAMVMAVALPSRARTESAEAQVERLAAEAVNAYRGADYNRAVELLTKAYEIRQVPALLYNLAKAYDKLGDVDHAADAYRRYVASLDADAKLKAKAEARLQLLDEQRRKNVAAERGVESTPGKAPRAGVESAPPPRAEPPPPQAPPPMTMTAPQSEAEQIRDKLRRERHRDRMRARWVALGLGITTVALGATAIGLSGSALSLQGQWQAQYGGDEDTRRALKSSALLRAGLADGFYAGTAVFAAITTYFLYRGFRAEPSAPSLAVSVTPAGAYFGLEGRF